MQTFLPYPDYKKSARVLDNARLGKQRVETKQIVLALTLPSYGWKSHPAVRMWKNYVPSLIEYGMIVCFEWRKRGFQDSLLAWFRTKQFDAPITHPHWLGDKYFHFSHQSNLLRKNPKHYWQFFRNIPNNFPYIWPLWDKQN